MELTSYQRKMNCKPLALGNIDEMGRCIKVFGYCQSSFNCRCHPDAKTTAAAAASTATTAVSEYLNDQNDIRQQSTIGCKIVVAAAVVK